MDVTRLELTPFQNRVGQPQPSAFQMALAVQEVLWPGPQSQADRVSRRLDFLFHEFISHHRNVTDAVEVMSALNDFLFREKEFSSVNDQTSQVQDILLGPVLEKRLGCSIALSLIYKELAGRIESCGVQYVNFPGFSLVKLIYNHQLLFFDPADDGRLLTVAELQSRLTHKYGKDVFLSPSFLETPSEFHVITRYLSKLKNLYFDLRDWQRLLAVLDMLVLVNPSRKSEYKERGLLLYQLGFGDDAAQDIEFFISQARPSPETDRLKRLLDHLHHPNVIPLYID